MKKLTVWILLAALLATLLTGCGGRSSGTAATEPSDEPKAQPLLWKVTDASGRQMYLFGTIHAGDERSKTALEQLSGVLEHCGALAVEFDIVAFESDYQAQMELLQSLLYTDGSTVRDHVSEAQYEWLKTTLSAAGLYNALMDYYSLAMWEMTAEQAMLTKNSGLDLNLAMDSLLIHRAYELEKPVYDVESAAFQYGMLSAFSDELYRMKIDAYMEMGAEAYGKELDELYEAWIGGDLSSLEKLIGEENDTSGLTPEQEALAEDYNRKMLDERNLGMRDKALTYLESGETVFFAVGTAHLLGQTGLVRLLTDAGCTVEPVGY